MSAPDRIWAWYFVESKRDEVILGGWTDEPDRKETEYVRNDIAATEADALRAENERLREALEGVLVGGNHLEAWLPIPHPPLSGEPSTALEQLGAGIAYDIWCCWRSIMQARAALEVTKT